MLAPLMKHLLVASVCSIVVFGLILAGLVAVDAPPWIRVLVLVAAFAAPDIYCRVFVPRGARKRLLKAVDPTAGPPPGATPADSRLIDHLDMLSEAKDYDALRSLLSDDFEVVAGRLRYGANTYIRTLKAGDRQLPGARRTDEVVVHPSEPDVIWVRSTHARKPRFGPAYVSTSWTRITITEDGSRVREITSGGVLHVA
jgi:ketosteroid isomerase-like protein